MRIKLSSVILCLVAGCASDPLRPSLVTAERWKQCWTMCGKKDLLESASAEVCNCRGGYQVTQRPTDTDQSQTVDVIIESRSIFEILGF